MTAMEFLKATLEILFTAMLRVALIVLVLAGIALLIVAAVDAGVRLKVAWQNRPGTQRGGVVWRAGLAYAPGHTWVRYRWGRQTVGLDDVARQLVTPPRAISLPQVGAVVHAGEVAVEITTGGRKASIVAPVDGTVVRVNTDVERDPSLLDKDPYGRGWLFRVTPAADDVTLIEGSPARDWLRSEARALAGEIENDVGPAAAADALAACPAQVLSDRQWKTLVRTFLKAA